MDHIPFNRQFEQFKRAGYSPSASTVNGWFSAAADILTPLYYHIIEKVLDSDYIQMDESFMSIVDKDKKRTRKGYIWSLYSVMSNLIFFHYDKGSRSKKVADSLLKDYHGALQTDGYGVYLSYEAVDGILPMSCWAHARRTVEQALDEDKERASYALEQIQMLYKIERMADEQNLDYQARAEMRSRLSYPILVAFEKWVRSNLI